MSSKVCYSGQMERVCSSRKMKAVEPSPLPELLALALPQEEQDIFRLYRAGNSCADIGDVLDQSRFKIYWKLVVVKAKIQFLSVVKALIDRRPELILFLCPTKCPFKCRK